MASEKWELEQRVRAVIEEMGPWGGALSHWKGRLHAALGEVWGKPVGTTPAPERETENDDEFKRNWKLMTEDLAFIRNLKATIETLETERDTWKRLCHQSDINRHALRDRLSKMNAEIAELRELVEKYQTYAAELEGGSGEG